MLVHLDRIGVDELAELVDAAWRTRAPRRLLADLSDLSDRSALSDRPDP